MKLGLFVDWQEDWSQLVQRCNWYTFRFASFEIEDDRIMGGVEATLVLLGLGARVRWNWRETEKTKAIDAALDDIDRGDTGSWFVLKSSFDGVEAERDELASVLRELYGAGYWQILGDSAPTHFEQVAVWDKAKAVLASMEREE